jgi:hypothetical protein
MFNPDGDSMLSEQYRQHLNTERSVGVLTTPFSGRSLIDATEESGSRFLLPGSLSSIG